MQNLRLVKKIASTLFALAVLWGTFFLSKLFIEVSPNKNIDFIPKNAYFVASIDGRSLTTEGIISLLKDDKNEVINLINQLLERKSDDNANEPTGIIFHSNIVVFKEELDETEITGVILNLSSEKSFDKNIYQYLNKNQVAASKDDVGIILTLADQENTTNKLSLKDLEMRAIQLCNAGKGEKPFESFNTSNKESLIQTWSKNGLIEENDVITGSNFNGYLVNGDIRFDGTMEIAEPSMSNVKRLKPAHSHFTSSIITASVRDSINSFLGQLSLPNVDIASISFNYQGTEIVEEPSFCIVPRIDILITSKKPYNLEKAIDSALCHLEDLAMIDKHLHYGGQKFHAKQISPNSFYIGISESPEIIDLDNNTLIEFTGPIAPLTTFYGDGMMRKFLEIIPIYSASQKLCKRVKNVDIKVLKSKGNKATATGEIEFKEHEDAIKSLIHFAVEGQLL